jgi:hypothetical protein
MWGTKGGPMQMISYFYLMLATVTLLRMLCWAYTFLFSVLAVAV